MSLLLPLLYRVLKLMREMFGPQHVNWWSGDQQKIAIKADQSIAILDPQSLVCESMNLLLPSLCILPQSPSPFPDSFLSPSPSPPLVQVVNCEDDSLNHLVTMAAKRLHTSLSK